MLPREHGSWAMLVAPPALGWAAAGGGPAGAGALLALAAAGAFLARTPLTALLSDSADARAWRWLGLYAAAAAGGLGGLLGEYARWGLLFLGLPAGAALGTTLFFAARRRAMSEVNELVGIAGLSLGAPAAFYAAAGRWEPRAAWLWVLCALYFSGPVFHVKMLVSRRVALAAPGAPAQAAKAAQARRLSLAYHSGAVLGVLAAAAAGAVPAPVAVPFALALGKTGWLGLRQTARLELKRVGWQEVAWTLAFLVILGVSYLPR